LVEEGVERINKTYLAEDYFKKQEEHLDGSVASIEASNKRSGVEGNSKFEFKNTILKIFKEIEDPFHIEFVGPVDYEQNPSEPTAP
jgi:hypothetical protein